MPTRRPRESCRFCYSPAQEKPAMARFGESTPLRIYTSWNASAQTFTLAGSGVRVVVIGNAAAVWVTNTASGTAFSRF